MSPCHESNALAWRSLTVASLVCVLLVRCGASRTPSSGPDSIGRIDSGMPEPPSSRVAPVPPAASTSAGAGEAARGTPQEHEVAPALRGSPLPSSTDAGAPRSPSGPCPEGIVHERLQQVVKECTSGDVRVCGVVKVRASADRKSVQVNFELSSTTGTDPFTNCVAARVNSIAWQCTLPGSQFSMDLGCKL